MEVAAARVEQARAVMLGLFPEGFEEVDGRDGAVELVAYTDAGGEERMWHVFGGAHGADVEAGWEERWRDFHRPARVGPLWIGPPWETPPEDATAILIEPGRAFGTGAHPTTRLCLEFLLELPHGSILDVGCGSGVVAIAAARLGFAPVDAVDVEVPAVDAARANAAANGVAINARVVDATTADLPRADIAVANITFHTVVAIAPRLDAERIVTSGYLVRDRPQLAPFAHLARRELDGWAADLFERR